MRLLSGVNHIQAIRLGYKTRISFSVDNKFSFPGEGSRWQVLKVLATRLQKRRGGRGREVFIGREKQGISLSSSGFYLTNGVLKKKVEVSKLSIYYDRRQQRVLHLSALPLLQTLIRLKKKKSQILYWNKKLNRQLSDQSQGGTQILVDHQTIYCDPFIRVDFIG